MQFTVPKFIERKTRIVGPLTFEQVIFLGIAVAISVFLYFTVPLTTFIIAAALVIGIALILAFFKIEKTPLPVVVKNLFAFTFDPKIYLWKRKDALPKLITKVEEKEEVKEEESLKITKQSRLKDLSNRLESKLK
jgi:predicted membrane protein